MANTTKVSTSRHTGAESTGIAIAAISAIAFGTLAISAKYAYREGAEALPLLAGRFVIATVLLGLFHVVIGRSLRVSGRQVRDLLLLGGFGYGFEAALFFAALERAPAGVVGLVFYSYPMWTTLIGFATGLEPFRWKVVAALATGTAGVVLVFSLPDTGLAGPLLALGAAVAVAVYFALMQVVLSDVPPLAAAFWTTTGAACSLLVASIVTRSGLPVAALPATGALGLASSFAFVALYVAITRIGSARAAVAAMLEPVATVILAAILLGEEVTVRIAVGAALIVAALPLLAARGRRAQVPADSI